MLKKINQSIYLTLGIGAILIGLIGLTAPFKLFPYLTKGLEGQTLHLTQELGAAFIFAGLVACWCAYHYARSRSIHYLLMVFFGLFALIHLMEYLAGNRSLLSPVLNSVPVLLLGIRLLAREKR